MVHGRWLDWRWWLGMRAVEVSQEPLKGIKVVAIVPAYNEEKHIEKTITSLQNQTYRLHKIIVVDDCSTDKTGEIARSLGVAVIRTPKNAGTKAQAQNYALKQLGEDIDLFLAVDADTILKEDAVYEAMRYFNDPNTAVVCGSVVPQRVKTFWEYGRLGEYLFAQALLKRAQEHTSLVLVASGCFSIFNLEAVRRLGYFDERTLAEDMDITWEFQDLGNRVYYARKALCYPVEPQTAKVYAAQLDRWYRGFLQNMKVRKFRIFRNNKPMALMVYAFLLWFAVSALMMPLFFYSITADIMMTLVYVVLTHATYVWVPSLICAYEFGLMKKAPLALVCYMVIPYINLVLYVRAFVREIVFGRTLAVWHKGH